MQIQTSRFGTIEIDERKIINFPHSIPGFTEREFIVVMIEAHLPFFWLQSLHNPDLAFVIADPFLFFPDYTPNISNSDKAFLGIKNDMLVYAITVVREGAQVTMNLLAPIIVNPATNIARQVVLENSNYTVRHNVSLSAIQAKVAAS